MKGDPGYQFPFSNQYWGSTEINNTTTQLSTKVNNNTMLLDPCQDKINGLQLYYNMYGNNNFV